MRNAIILHGKADPGEVEYYNPDYPAASNSHWIPWVQKQLMVRDIYTQTPEIPNSWKPHYPTWVKEFERYDLTPETILVGHSCGAGFMLKWLSAHMDVKVDKIVLVAPSLGYGWDDGSFFEGFKIDQNLTSRASITILHSDNDREDIQRSTKEIRATLPKASYVEFHNYGHFCIEDMHTEKFPELVDIIVND